MKRKKTTFTWNNSYFPAFRDARNILCAFHFNLCNVQILIVLYFDSDEVNSKYLKPHRVWYKRKQHNR